MNYVKFTAVMAGNIALKQYLVDEKILPTSMQKYLYTMASIAIMIGGAVVNAASFIGGNYLARYLSWDDPKVAQEEKVRHDKAIEAYQAAYAKYQKDRAKLLDGIATSVQSKIRRNKISLTPTTLSSSTTKLTHTSKYQYPKSLSFLTSINPVSSKKKANSCLLAQAPLPLGTQHFDFFDFIIIICMDLQAVVYFLRWTVLTYGWFEAKRIFFGLIPRNFNTGGKRLCFVIYSQARKRKKNA